MGAVEKWWIDYICGRGAEDVFGKVWIRMT
jgi:hypothetical protein